MAASSCDKSIYSDIITSSEVDSYASSLTKIPLNEIGCPRWQNQHGYMERLNMQAIQEVSFQNEETVKEALVLHDKIQTLIHDIISTELWKTMVFPEIVKIGITDRASVPLYMSLFHEATVCSLLETVLYHKESCECAEESIVDLLDYCYRKMTIITASTRDTTRDPEIQDKDKSISSTAKDLLAQQKSIDFDVGIKSISILKYIIDHAESLPLAVMDRLLNTYDMPCFLAQLLDNPPWKRKSSRDFEVYADGKWTIQPCSGGQLTKIDGQVWLSLYQLLLCADAMSKYEMKSFNKGILLKLRRFFNDVLLDQLPCLKELQRFLENLAVMETPSVCRSLILEQVPEIREQLYKHYCHQWHNVASEQLNKYYSPSDNEMRGHAERLASTYDLDLLERMIDVHPKCVVCSVQAEKRCGRCQSQWYCSRQCQLSDWPTHKGNCEAK